jgi:cell division protease FtsH
MTKEQLQANLAMLLAGHTSEKMIFGNVSTGPHNDIKRATELARKMITDYGMSDKLVLRTFGSGEESEFYGIERKDYSEQVAKEIDDEVHRLIYDAHETAKKLLYEHKDRLIYLAEKLMEFENLEGPELEKIFTEPIPKKISEKESAGAINASRSGAGVPVAHTSVIKPSRKRSTD